MSDQEPPLPGDDTALVSAAQAGDLQAFEQLVARHRDKVYTRVFALVRNQDEALDLSQEAWARAWRRLSQFHRESSFLTWITRIAINLGLDHIRKERRHRVESLEQLEDEQGGVERQLMVIAPNPTEGLERAELKRKIDQALGQLSPEHRAVITLYEFEEMEYKQIAKELDCSIGTVMSRLFYARRRLAAILRSSLGKEPFS
jgi:RNA polymerase sigma-70 factor (ECF subfamily)